MGVGAPTGCPRMTVAPLLAEPGWRLEPMAGLRRVACRFVAQSRQRVLRLWLAGGPQFKLNPWTR